jgi:YidC/Oxa1 family membrane protein insertase
MEKNTLLAVVLSVIVITGGFVIQNMLYPPQPATDAAVSTPVEQPASNDSNAVTPENDASSGRTAIQPSSQQTIGNPIRPVPEENLSREPVAFENDLPAGRLRSGGRTGCIIPAPRSPRWG